MRLYDNSYPSGYDELKTYYPVWYREVLEMDALWRVMGQQLDSIQSGITQAVDNCFISTADAETLRKLEEFLYISYEGSRTLEERRALISSFFIGTGHIGEQELKDITALFTNAPISVELIGGTVEISVTRELSDRFNLIDCLFMILKRIPAHLKVVFNDILLPIRFVTTENVFFKMFNVHLYFYNSRSNKGIIFQSFDFALVATASNIFETNDLALSPIAIRSSEITRHSEFAVTAAVQTEKAFYHEANRFSGLCARQNYAFNGTITIDSMYHLDGAVLLNGSRKLNADIIKEEI